MRKTNQQSKKEERKKEKKEKERTEDTIKVLAFGNSFSNDGTTLIDDIAKKARKNFSETGAPDIDAKFLKESVSALRELFDLLSEQDGNTTGDGNISIVVEKAIGEWNK